MDKELKCSKVDFAIYQIDPVTLLLVKLTKNFLLFHVEKVCKQSCITGMEVVFYRKPHETQDALMAYFPEIKTVFTGDMYYDTFPNTYPPRGLYV